jgi:AcrR family transcriptional regulator
VSQALALLDAEGIEALSMRQLGARLNAGATSLYTHVASKDELMELAVDEVFGEVAVPGGSDPARWRAGAGRCAASIRSVILRHPWIVTVLGEAGLVYLGPNMMRLFDGLLGLFETAGFALAEANIAINTLVAYVIGTGVSEAAWLTTLARNRQDERAWIERWRPAAQAAAEAYPRLQRLYAMDRGKDPAAVRDADFAAGLERVLDGLAARLGGPGTAGAGT